MRWRETETDRGEGAERGVGADRFNAEMERDP